MAGTGEMVITGLGMRTAVGQNMIQTCASVRAGIARFAEWDHQDDTMAEGALVAAAIQPDLGNDSWTDKFRDLAWQPFLEALWRADLANLEANLAEISWGVYLSTPRDDRPGVTQESLGVFHEEVKDKDLLPFLPNFLEVFPKEHAGGLLALDKALNDLARGIITLAVVGGVDSLLHSDYLYWLMTQKKLKSDLTPIGLIPGEAASFLVVESQANSQSRGVQPLARITPVQQAKEPAPVGKPCTGEVLTQVLRNTIQDTGCDPAEIHHIATDLNGERWRFLEWSLAHARMPPQMPINWDFWHPADCLGDIGAATATTLLGLTARAFERGYAVGKAMPICVSSESGERAAVSVLPVPKKQGKS